MDADLRGHFLALVAVLHHGGIHVFEDLFARDSQTNYFVTREVEDALAEFNFVARLRFLRASQWQRRPGRETLETSLGRQAANHIRQMKEIPQFGFTIWRRTDRSLGRADAGDTARGEHQLHGGAVATIGEIEPTARRTRPARIH